MLRYSFADRSFSANSFSTATRPSSKEQATQIRIRGEHGLGDGFSFDYDFRYAFLYKSKTKRGVTFVDTNNGPQDQRVRLNYGLIQENDFADAIGLGVISPGSSTRTSPALDSGQWAVEPVYRIGFKPGFARLTANLDFASRVFLDGGVTQFRTYFEVEAPLSHRVNVIGNLFFVRSVRMSSYDGMRDRGELYDLLRLGIGAQFRLTKSVESVLVYESAIAGIREHANQRFTFGMKFKY